MADLTLPTTLAVPEWLATLPDSGALPEVLEQALGREAIKDFQPMQPGDVVATAADTSALEHWVGFKPSTSIVFGVDKFAEWFIHFYRV